MAQYTVIGFHEETGQTFAHVVEAEDEYAAMKQSARTWQGDRNTAIVGAVEGEARFYPPCEESANLAYACDLVNL